MSVLLRDIREISSDAAKVLGKAGFTSDTDIQSLTREDLNELFPGPERLRLRKNISELIQNVRPINAVLKELSDFIPDDCVKAALTKNGALNDYLFILRDQRTKVENIQSFLDAHIGLLEEYTRKQEVLEVSLPDQKTAKAGPASPRASYEPTCAPHPVDRHFYGLTEGMGQGQSLSTVKVQAMVSGKTFDCHHHLLQRVKQLGGLHIEETPSGKVVVVFCPVSSRHMTDIEAATKHVPGGVPVILVVMHHTQTVDYPNIVRSLGANRSWDLVNVLYHETVPGLLTCPLNDEAVAQLRSALLKHGSVSPAAASGYVGGSAPRSRGGAGGSGGGGGGFLSGWLGKS